MTEIRIRPALVSEAEALTELAMRSKAYWGYDHAFMARCRPELTVRKAAIEAGLVAVAEAGRVLGFVALDREGEEAEIALLFVEPDTLQSGVGRALFGWAEAEARGMGVSVLVTDPDPQALGFYLRMGMAPAGEVPSGSIPGRMLPHVRKALQ